MTNEMTKMTKLRTPLLAIALATAALASYAQADQFLEAAKKKVMASTVTKEKWDGPTTGPKAAAGKTVVFIVSGDLAPARRNAGRLADAGEAWAKSTAPGECNAPADIGDKVSAIAVDARAYAALVEANGSDQDVKSALGKLHDQFEAAHMVCMPEGMKGLKGMEHPKRPPH